VPPALGHAHQRVAHRREVAHPKACRFRVERFEAHRAACQATVRVLAQRCVQDGGCHAASAVRRPNVRPADEYPGVRGRDVSSVELAIEAHETERAAAVFGEPRCVAGLRQESRPRLRVVGDA
jgi:hypothetical protein